MTWIRTRVWKHGFEFQWIENMLKYLNSYLASQLQRLCVAGDHTAAMQTNAGCRQCCHRPLNTTLIVMVAFAVVVATATTSSPLGL